VGIEMIYKIKRRHAVLWLEKDTTTRWSNI